MCAEYPNATRAIRAGFALGRSRAGEREAGLREALGIVESEPTHSVRHTGVELVLRHTMVARLKAMLPAPARPVTHESVREVWPTLMELFDNAGLSLKPAELRALLALSRPESGEGR
jgi:hypothetical protein